MLGVKNLRILPAKGEEDPPKGAGPRELVTALAATKAEEVAAAAGEDDVVVAADTIVWFDGRPFGKPHSREEAAAMLRSLSGNTHHVYTGVAVLRGGVERLACECTAVHPALHRNRRTHGQGRRLWGAGPGRAVCAGDRRRLF